VCSPERLATLVPRLWPSKRRRTAAAWTPGTRHVLGGRLGGLAPVTVIRHYPSVPRPGLVAIVVLATSVAAVALCLAADKLKRLSNERHPAVSEHGEELIETAVKRMHCERGGVTVVAEGPMRARAEGCGKTVTFFWERVRTLGGPPRWHEIDPNCTVDYMGVRIPCH